MEKSKQASTLFLSGNNCAQSVVLSFADELKYSKELAVKIAAGFGGGMGKTQGTCGAVTGAIMILGILRGDRAADNEELKSLSYDATRKFIAEFTRSKGSISCRELTGCDMNTSSGAEQFKEEGVMEKICAPCVEEAVRLVETLR